MRSGKVNLLIDGQWGSTGKGKIAGYIVTKKKIDLAVCNFMPNAGHTFKYNGKEFMFRQLPVGAVNKNASILLASTSAIDLNLLDQEVKEFEKTFGFPVHDRLYIDSRAVIITEEHIK